MDVHSQGLNLKITPSSDDLSDVVQKLPWVKDFVGWKKVHPSLPSLACCIAVHANLGGVVVWLAYVKWRALKNNASLC